MSRETRPSGTAGEADSDRDREDAAGAVRHPQVERTIDELLDDESWNDEPGVRDFAHERFEELVALAGDGPVEELLPAEALFPDADDDQDDDSALRPGETRQRRFG